MQAIEHLLNVDVNGLLDKVQAQGPQRSRKDWKCRPEDRTCSNDEGVVWEEEPGLSSCKEGTRSGGKEGSDGGGRERSRGRELARTDLTRRVGYVGGMECFSGRKSSDCGQTEDQAVGYWSCVTSVKHLLCCGCPWPQAGSFAIQLRAPFKGISVLGFPFYWFPFYCKAAEVVAEDVPELGHGSWQTALSPLIMLGAWNS